MRFLRRWGFWKVARRLVLYPCVATASALYLDNKLHDDRLVRNARAIWTGARILWEYKMRWDPESLNSDLHRRVAEMILQCCRANGGLYIKFGQGIASMNHILPEEYNEVFQVLHDKAPSMPYESVLNIILEDLKVDPHLVFATFDPTPVASASIAQVHYATLHNGQAVAVKVQKEYIANQVPWDLFCYQLLIHIFEKFFELPLSWSLPYTLEQMQKECSFEIEAMNSQKTRQLLRNEAVVFDYHHDFMHYLRQRFGYDNNNQPLSEEEKKQIHKTNVSCYDRELNQHVYVPKVYPQYCSKRVLTAEWCDGYKLTDLEKIESELKLSPKRIMETVVSLFGWQIFQQGFVHCDPHPGNILVRRKNTGMRTNNEWVNRRSKNNNLSEIRIEDTSLSSILMNSLLLYPFNLISSVFQSLNDLSWLNYNHNFENDFELVFLDHGLYIEEPQEFRQQYCTFWTSMFLNDQATMASICREWGVDDLQFFASMQMLRPFLENKGGVHYDSSNLSKAEIAQMQLDMKERVTTVLKETESIPRQLVFVGRNMNIVRANNKDLGSPVNRPAILARYAAKGLENSNSYNYSYWNWRARMFGLSLYYNWYSFYNSYLVNSEEQQTSSIEDRLEEELLKQFGSTDLILNQKMFSS